MDLGLEALTSPLYSGTGRDLFRPEFFRLALPADRERLHELLKRVPTLVVHDELHSQLAELVRTRNPAIKFTKAELAQAAIDHLGGVTSEHYGVWVYYPWSGRLVHLLDEAEFTLVRTDRNRNKITSEEQERLGKLRIGVIGLSVGQSICLTLALERGFGELRIADFDTLDLSNLNRIRSGVHSLGHLKTVNVAREIAEIDPFLKVTLYNEGLTRDNINGFLNDGGKLDILVDECDSVDVKIFCRQRAKALRIPVIMDTSDRGMLDVERFDLEPDRPILHGLIDHLNIEDAAKAKTNEEKLPFVLPILNVDTLSKRMKASMLEIESSVTTWPQLASSVVLGGALGAEYCRRIALGQSAASGRWYVDLEDITGEGPEHVVPEQVSSGIKPLPLNLKEMVALAEHPLMAGLDEGLGAGDAERLAEAGALAPSAGNNQPWRFLFANGRLHLFHDGARSFSQLDGGSLIPAIGLGACIENVVLKATELRVDLEAIHYPIDGCKELVAVFIARQGRSSIFPDPLASAITVRCTNRKKPIPRPIADHVFSDITMNVAQVSGCEVHVVRGASELADVAQLVCTAERLRMLNPIGHRELFAHEIRWTAAEARSTSDGLDLATLELKLSEQAAMRVASDPAAIGLLRSWNAGNGFKKMSGDAIRGSGAVCLISVLSSSPAALLLGGRAVERMWLSLALNGIAVHPISAPIFLAHHVRFGGAEGFSPKEQAEILMAFNGIQHAFSTGSREPLFLARLAHADPPTVRSLRRPMGEIFHIHQTVTA